jgi:hypothetical protein
LKGGAGSRSARGHYYSDKAPGQPLAALPVTAATRVVLGVVGVKANSETGIVAQTYVDTIATAALPAVVAALALYWVALRLGASPGGAAFAAGAFGLATPMWIYATFFWDHALATAGLIVAFTLAVELRRAGSPRRDFLLGAAVGLSAGWAAISEFPSAVPAALIAVFALTHVWTPNRRHRVLVGLMAGGVPCGLVLLAYNWAAFGSPLHFGYSNEVSFVLRRLAGEDTGIAGHTYPKANVVRELLVGRFRGLLPLAPALLLAPLGIVRLARRPETRTSAVVLAVIPLYYLIENSAFIDWHGGSSYGPRHLSGALPFLCLPLALVWTGARRPLRVAMSGLGVYGVGLALMAVSTKPQLNITFRRPLTQVLWPAFRDGRLSLNYAGFLTTGLASFQHSKRFAWNLGEQVGLGGHASLVPLYAAWAAALAVWFALERRSLDIGIKGPLPEGQRSQNTK